MSRYKIAILQRVPTPYRNPLFERIATHPSMELHVYFTASSRKDKGWISEHSSKFNCKSLPWFPLSSYINPSIIPELVRNNYNAIIAGGYYPFTNQVAFILSKIKNTPFILWSASTIYEASFLRKIAYPVIKLIVKHSDAFIACSSRSKEYLISLGAHPGKISIAPNAIDVDFFKAQSLKHEPQKENLKSQLKIEEKKLILYVGRLVESKGLKYLMEAYRDLKKEKNDVDLMIIGDGPQRDELVSLCQQEQIKDVHLLGFIPNEQLPLYYSIADVFVFPSTRDAFGMVVLEAMACGLPIVITNRAGASADVVKHGVNGYITGDRNAGQLYEAIKGILSDSEIEKSMGEQSQKIIEEGFTLEQAVQGFIDAINHVTKSSI